jgi:molybdate transport system substrate-binding protein
MTTRRTWLALLVAAGVAWIGGVQPVSAQGNDVLVFAAASLKNALDEIAKQWHHETGKIAVTFYAASSILIKQIAKDLHSSSRATAADIFFSADLDWMDYAEQKDLIKAGTRFNLLENRLVLIAPKDSSVSVNIQPGFDLAALLKGGRLAMGRVDAVPAGKYGKAALEKLDVWNSVKDKIAQAESVRAALLLVSQGKAAFGIVYQTDAAADANVKIVGTFPENTHPPIIYPVALTKQSTNADAQAFLNYLRSPTARAAFERQGFTVLAPGGQRS